MSRSRSSRTLFGQGAKIAIVEGDDILHRLDDLAAEGVGLENMETGEPLSTVRDLALSANVYISTNPK